jgi:hypothetical protein
VLQDGHVVIELPVSLLDTMGWPHFRQKLASGLTAALQDGQ